MKYETEIFQCFSCNVVLQTDLDLTDKEYKQQFDAVATRIRTILNQIEMHEDYEDLLADKKKLDQIENLLIDRIDYNGNYEPLNCRWATYKEQARNTSRNHCFELNGKIKCAAEWCEELGIKSSTFFQRLKNGLNPFTGERV